MADASWFVTIVFCWAAFLIVLFGERLTWLARAWDVLKVALIPARWRRG